MWNKRKKSFRLLGKRYTKNFSIEVREYPPCLRNIKIGSKFWSLNFPYIIFVGVIESDVRLAVAFSKNPIKSMYDVIYHPVLPHIGELWELCLSDVCLDKLYFEKENKIIDVMIADWWNSKFGSFNSGHSSIDSLDALKFNFGRLVSWEKLNKEQVIEQLCYGPKLFKYFISDFYSDLRSPKLEWLKSIRKKPNEKDKKIMLSAQIDHDGECWSDLADDSFY
jgi:hypothetical protein